MKNLKVEKVTKNSKTKIGMQAILMAVLIVLSTMGLGACNSGNTQNNNSNTEVNDKEVSGTSDDEAEKETSSTSDSETENKEGSDKNATEEIKYLNDTVSVGDTVSFGKEDKEWIVLEKGKRRALLFSKESIGERAYHDKWVNITWEECDLRKWLNEEFYKDAFTLEEQNRIYEVIVENEDNFDYNIEGGSDTKDKIFLLSIDEAKKYFEDDKVSDISFYGWLRSPGCYSNSAAQAYCFDYKSYYTSDAIDYEDDVYPALWVSLESSDSDVEMGSEESDDNNSSNDDTKIIKSLSDNVSVGDIVMFGKYDTQWIILDKEGGKALLLTEEEIGRRGFYEDLLIGQDSITWENCALRKRLNEDFYNSFFTEKEKKQICEVTVKNDDNPKFGTEGGNDTKDKIFLLSIEEAERYFEDDDARAIGCYWSLRSPGFHDYERALVLSEGAIDFGHAAGYNEEDELGFIRPALWVNLES